MGLSSSSSKTTTTPAFGPQLTGAANTLTGVYNAQAPKIAGYADQIGGLIPGLLDQVKNGNPAINAASHYVTDTLSHGPGQNPYLDQVLANSNGQVRNQSEASLGLKGLTGGSSYADIISRNVANNDMATRYADFKNQQQLRAQAAGMAPEIAAGGLAPIASLLSAADSASGLPMDAALKYGAGIGGLLGNYTNSTTKQSNGLLQSLLGAGAQLGSAAILHSDRRVKRDIVKLGQEPDGLGVYEYNYTWDAPNEPKRRGVMADEVAKLRPHALGPVLNGYATVDYGKLV